MVQNDECIHHDFAQIPSVYVVPDDKCTYDDFEHILSTYTVYDDDFIPYNLEGLSAT